uniref:Uncharacterized protein n=1 Tax=Myoviridae sp. ctNYa18 TaxID=2825090 RepID=A0A8S5PFJ5_9CAUD|nr:MAG TPA: hypothetical protein [Myoviridae sp. ctNYa18]
MRLRYLHKNGNNYHLVLSIGDINLKVINQ